MDLINSVLLVGGGGREHALLKAFLRSDRPICAFAWPGNPGMERDGCVIVEDDIKEWEDLAAWADMNEVGLTVVGSEVPLVEGITDTFRKHGLTVFGPSKAAARIEGDKAFAKKLMKEYGIPTADFEIFKSKADALEYVKAKGAPLVIKVSGLAAGKGAIMCAALEEAEAALTDIFDKKSFGAAGQTVVIEDMMYGEEASLFVLTDGKSYKILPAAQDHKRIGDGDTGPNTGGMGAYAPVPGVVDKAMLSLAEKEIIIPTLAAMEKEKARYRGLLYVGLMITENGPKVVEYNCRFGDPETQAVLPLINCDWFETFKACAEGNLASVTWEIDPGYCAAVVLASGGYPGKYEKGKTISGIEDVKDGVEADIYFAGVASDDGGNLVTDGGRVLTVSAKGKTLSKAIAQTYAAASKIKFDGVVFRKDIGAKGLKKKKAKSPP